MQFAGIQNMQPIDDSQLIQSFAQFNLVNHNQGYMYPQNLIDQYPLGAQNYNNSNDVSLENNYSNNETPLSSVPSHMKNTNRQNRSQSINRVPESSQYMKESFLFDKLTSDNSKDDNTIQRDQNPLNIERQEPRSFAPRILKYNMPEIDNLSSPSRSSQSSRFTFNDAASCSSLDLSFDGSGNPYIKAHKSSAFAKVQPGEFSDRGSSLSADDQKHIDNTEIEKGLLIDADDNMDDNDNKFQNKSSFFRLKDTSSDQPNPDDTPQNSSKTLGGDFEP